MFSLNLVTKSSSMSVNRLTQLLNTWENGIREIWGNPALTADILAEIGTEGKELFELSAKTAEFLESLQPGCTAKAFALLKPFTIDKSGTVSLV